jgi:hypothetical protein
MEITRVANLTGLDSLGIPVGIVSRPNSRSVAVSQSASAPADVEHQPQAPLCNLIVWRCPNYFFEIPELNAWIVSAKMIKDRTCNVG